MVGKKTNEIWEYGDFQTPYGLALECARHLSKHDPAFAPMTIIEPTCGTGSFLIAAADAFPGASKIIGIDIDNKYLDSVRDQLTVRDDRDRFQLINGDFFKIDWQTIISNASKPILVIGNPPWVTSADIGRLKGGNLPNKSNFQKYSGLDAVTGKANFDISEWMLIQILDWLQAHSGCVAMLCKTAVARKILRYAWRSKIATVDSQIVQIDAMAHFGAAVDACFFILKTNSMQSSIDCHYFESFESKKPAQVFGYHDDIMLSNVPAFNKYQDLLGNDRNYVWRSGLKHDCSKVMELRITPNGLLNGYGETVYLEESFVFPLLKSSDVGNGRVQSARSKVIVTQSKVGEPTQMIQEAAPKTWAYLEDHAAALDGRGSSIYKNKPRFSIFGVGAYSFTDWKVAISGFYKNLKFHVVGPIDEKPVIFDDTVYVLSANSKEEAIFLSDILNSKEAQAFLASMVFWTDKRPITVDLLKRLHIGKVAKLLGRQFEYDRYVAGRDDLPLFNCSDHAYPVDADTH